MANQTCQLLSVADSSMMVKGLDILDLVERLWADRPRDNDVPNKKTLLELLDKGEVQCGDEEVHKGLQKEILLDLDYEGEPDEEEVRAAVMIEASGKRIKSLAAFLTRVLESPEAPQNIEESHVLDLAFSGTNLTEQELKAILHIANALTPYVLKTRLLLRCWVLTTIAKMTAGQQDHLKAAPIGSAPGTHFI
ncbi:hypothetical protein BGZ67_007111 [Mortierella alpina]|nr:hypothetical protein BGZ67_007111 [Mortierella alpina]